MANDQGQKTMDIIFDYIVAVFGTIGTYAALFGGIGTYLLLPHRHGAIRPRAAHGAGAVAVALGLLIYMVYWRPPDLLLPAVFLYIFGATAIAGAVLTITSRDPVASALWFASVVLSTAGLILLADAPFLAAGTIIVYAGAVIVTFLFVIMLAQMEGRADYDRAARAPGWATLTSFVILWCLLVSIATIRTGPAAGANLADTARNRLQPESKLLRSRNLEAYFGSPDSPMVAVVQRSVSPMSQIAELVPQGDAATTGEPGADRTADAPAPEALVARPNVAGIGAAMYTDHLASVAIAGALLFVALVGAVAITNPRPPIRPGTGTDPAQRAAVGTSRP